MIYGGEMGDSSVELTAGQVKGRMVIFALPRSGRGSLRSLGELAGQRRCHRRDRAPTGTCGFFSRARVPSWTTRTVPPRGPSSIVMLTAEGAGKFFSQPMESDRGGRCRHHRLARSADEHLAGGISRPQRGGDSARQRPGAQGRVRRHRRAQRPHRLHTTAGGSRFAADLQPHRRARAAPRTAAAGPRPTQQAEVNHAARPVAQGSPRHRAAGLDSTTAPTTTAPAR